MTLRELAHHYAAQRRPVFPLVPGGKPPLIGADRGGRGFHDRTCTPATLDAWWHEEPEANVGGCPGDVGCLAFDNDTDDTRAVLQRYGLLSEPTYTVHTKHGTHHYFRVSDPALLQAHSLDGVVVRGWKGYVVLPGSRLSCGFTYHDEGTIDDALPLPPEVAAALRVTTTREGSRHRAHEALTAPRVTAGNRHAAIVSVAGHLIGKGVGEEYAAQLLQAYNQTYCDPPKSPREVADVLQWVLERERSANAALCAGFVEEMSANPPSRPSVFGRGASFRPNFSRRSA